MLKFKSVLLLMILCVTAVNVNADKNSVALSPIKQIAQIALNLNHFPGEREKQQLNQMMSNDAIGDDIRIIAHALHNMRHSVNITDKKELEKIIAKDASKASVKELAKVISSINHAPTSEQIEDLKKIIEV